MKVLLEEIITSSFLAQSPEEPYFCEASVQLKIAFEIWKRIGREPKLEVRHPKTNDYLDVLVACDGIRFGIELKYKTTDFPGFQFTRQEAQDHGRYDFMGDLSRIESFISSGFIDKGFAILLTNDRAYWSQPRATSLAHQFQLADNVTVTGSYVPRWKGRTKILELASSNTVQWLIPKALPEGYAPFRALIATA